MIVPNLRDRSALVAAIDTLESAATALALVEARVRERLAVALPLVPDMDPRLDLYAVGDDSESMAEALASIRVADRYDRLVEEVRTLCGSVSDLLDDATIAHAVWAAENPDEAMESEPYHPGADA